MRLRVFAIVFSCFAAVAVGACGLNPQPLPPETDDGSVDAALSANPEAGGGMDSGALEETGPKGGDAAADASEDATDASASDAAEDARDDADDGALDAGEDE